ncbi:MAG: CheY-like chemotaxis protein [Candidatus Binatia bacterium]|jgi:CheY-like chemotaxis protein
MARILVIDDEAPIRELICFALDSSGHQVADAASGEEAMKINRAAPADVIITDIAMPQTDGIEIIKILREEFPSTKIIAISGVLSTTPGDNLYTATRAGADMAFAKPFDVFEMAEAVNTLAQTS